MQRAPIRAVSQLPALLVAILTASLILTALPNRAEAQNMVVVKFSDRSKKRLGRKAWTAVARALKKRGVRLVSQKQYMRQARKNRIKPRRALRPKAVRKLAGKLKLDAVIGGSAVRRRGRYIVTINARGKNGQTLLKKAYRLRRPVFPAKVAAQVADAIMAKVGGPAEVAAAPEPKPEPAPEKAPAAGDSKPADKTDDAFLPAWARNEEKDEPAPAAAPAASAPAPAADTSANAAEVEDEAPARKSDREAGSVNDVLVSAGGSFHYRAGLHPRHEAPFYPGLRVDARVFMGAFLDVPVVRDIGFGGMFDMSLGLEYSDPDTTWSAQQMQWRAELIYRLALDTGLKPAFMFHFGYGSLSTKIDTQPDDLALSTGYAAPYGGLDIYLMLWEPMLRFYVTGSFLFLVSPSDDVSGDGMGFTAGAGFDFNIVDMIHLGLGWEMTQFMMKDNAGIGDYSDMYQGYYLRVGYSYH